MLEKILISIAMITVCIVMVWLNIKILVFALSLWPIWLVIIIISVLMSVFSKDK